MTKNHHNKVMPFPVKRNEGKLSCVHLLGAGPGDPELITVKAVRILGQADVVVYDRLVNPELLQHCRKDCERIYVGKRQGHHSMAQNDICALLCRLATAGKRVARLKGGDPFVFGRGGEELQALQKRGIPCEVVPGITAATACAATTGIPLTHRDHAQAVVFMTAQRGSDGEQIINWQLACQANTTVAVYMGLSMLQGISNQLISRGIPADKPVALIANGSCKNQHTLYSSLSEVAMLAKAENMQSPALLIIGEVVNVAVSAAVSAGSERSQHIV